MAYDKVVDSAQLEADLKVVADAIREKGGTTEQLSFPQGMKQAVEAIQTGVTKPEQEKTIDITENGTTEVIPDSGKVLSKVTVNVEVESGGGSGSSDVFQYLATLNNAFREAEFEEGTHINLTLKRKLLGCSYAFYNIKNLESIKLINSNEIIITGQSFCDSCKYLKKVDLSEFNIIFNNMNSAYKNCVSLKEIIGEIDFSKTSSVFGMFNITSTQTYADFMELEEVRFKESTLSLGIDMKCCKNLSDNSIQSIIDGLATVTTAQTLTLHADVKAKLTDTQLTTITSKNWTLA